MSDENKDIAIDIIEMNDEYKEWLHYAQMDLDSAKYLNGAPMHPKPIHVVCYHCQQAAEKAAKALIVYYGCQGGGLPKKHDVEFLLRQVKNLLKEDKGFAIPDDILVPEAIVAEEIKAAQAEAQTLTDQLITAPVSGHVVSLTSVADPVFASEMMGKGAAIIPSDGNVYAPFDGKMSIVAETGHAYGIETADGAEVLIHIGIDTVSLAGAYFQTKVKQDQIVKKGTLLGTFDITGIKDSGLDPTVMVIVTNTLAYMDVAQIVKSHTAIQLGQQLLSLSTDD